MTNFIPRKHGQKIGDGTCRQLIEKFPDSEPTDYAKLELLLALITDIGLERWISAFHEETVTELRQLLSKKRTSDSCKRTRVVRKRVRISFPSSIPVSPRSERMKRESKQLIRLYGTRKGR